MISNKSGKIRSIVLGAAASLALLGSTDAGAQRAGGGRNSGAYTSYAGYAGFGYYPYTGYSGYGYGYGYPSYGGHAIAPQGVVFPAPGSYNGSEETGELRAENKHRKKEIGRLERENRRLENELEARKENEYRGMVKSIKDSGRTMEEQERAIKTLSDPYTRPLTGEEIFEFVPSILDYAKSQFPESNIEWRTGRNTRLDYDYIVRFKDKDGATKAIGFEVAGHESDTVPEIDGVKTVMINSLASIDEIMRQVYKALGR